MFFNYRNSQKRIYRPGISYFITTNTKGRFPYFENELLCRLMVAELKLCKILKGFKLYAFCILKDHLHLLLEPNQNFNISRIMFSLKKNFTHNANRVLGFHDFDFQLNVNRNGKREGGQALACLQMQMNKYVFALRKRYFKQKPDLPHFQWQSSYYDHIIRDQKDFDKKYNYTIWNFKKHKEQNLPEDYRFTSLRFKDMVDKYLLLY